MRAAAACCFLCLLQKLDAAVQNCDGNTSTKTILLWSVYRSGSSTFARSMGQRQDTMLLFEPFTLVHFLGQDRGNPRHADIAPNASWTFENLWRQLTEHNGSESLVFAKDFATSFPRWRWDSFPMDRVEHAFLIRDPAEALASMYAMVEVHPESTGYTYFDAEECGFEAQAELFDYLMERTNRAPVVVDHKDLMLDPRGTLEKFCEAMGIHFDPSMLEFTLPLPPHANGLWDGFFEKINASTGFHPPSAETRGPRIGQLPAGVSADVARLRPLYERLRQHRVAAVISP